MPDASDLSTPSSEETRHYATEAANLAASRRGIGQLARLGYFSIGVVYTLMGALAVLGLLGVSAGQYTGSGGALRTVVAQPFGRVMLAVIAAGLVAYVSWRFAQSVLDVEGRGNDTRGLLRRAGLAFSALSYAGLTAVLVRSLVSGGAQVRDPKSDWTTSVMSYPAGLVLVGLIGAVVLAVALVQFRTAYRAGFLDSFDASTRAKRWVSVLGRFGFSARGVVFGIVGGFLVVAAVQTNPDEAKGLGEALRTLGRQPYGRFLIGLVAAGLLSYGLFMFAKARFRHLAPEDDDGQDGGAANRDGADA